MVINNINKKKKVLPSDRYYGLIVPSPYEQYPPNYY